MLILLINIGDADAATKDNLEEDNKENEIPSSSSSSGRPHLPSLKIKLKRLEFGEWKMMKAKAGMGLKIFVVYLKFIFILMPLFFLFVT